MFQKSFSVNRLALALLVIGPSMIFANNAASTNQDDLKQFVTSGIGNAVLWNVDHSDFAIEDTIADETTHVEIVSNGEIDQGSFGGIGLPGDMYFRCSRQTCE